MHDRETELIETLAQRCGVCSDYVDIDGVGHRVPTDAKRELLRAMGQPGAGEPELAAALARLDARDWSRLLPPVVVLAEGSPQAIEVTLPAGADAADYRYLLTEERGTAHQGTLATVGGAVAEADVGQQRYRRYRFALPLGLAAGYHRFELRAPGGGDDAAQTSLIVAPERCFVPPAIAEGRRVWGPASQLYALRSAHNWGIGDFSDLPTMVEICQRAGAAIVGLSPIHALFPRRPLHVSPYSPSSRLFLNVLHLSIEAISDFSECERARQRVHGADFQARLQALRHAETVDYAAVAAAKRELLELLFEHFRREHLDRAITARGAQFREFQRVGGETLRRHATFEMLEEHFDRQHPPGWPWWEWPEPYRDPCSEQVATLALDKRERVELFEYLQWQAELQLGAAGRRADELGLGIGLYQDLAVSVEPSGAEVWANQRVFARGVAVGAPPDAFNLKGQDWGLVPWIPDQLRELGYRPFIEMLRANMRHCGALRIDHVMGLRRLFWVPHGRAPTAGAYVRYPLDDLLGIVALESQRNRCLVIGEDLGTVPDEVRHKMPQRSMLGYRLLLVEREPGGDFRPPHDYPSQAIVAATTHDLPTLAGYWAGRDLKVREALALFPSDEMRREQIADRVLQRAALLAALEREGLLPDGITADPDAVPLMTAPLCRALHAYVARSPSPIMLVQWEDLLGELEQANLPGTVDLHPNWRRKLSVDLERLLEQPDVAAALTMLCTLRSAGGI